MLISPETRRIECEPTAEHHHVWLDRGMVMIAQPPRFNTRQAARKAAIRAGMEVGSFEVKRCALPCRFTVKRERKRKRRKCPPLREGFPNHATVDRSRVTAACVMLQWARDATAPVVRIRSRP